MKAILGCMSRRWTLAVAMLGLLIHPLPALGQTATLVKDINTQPAATPDYFGINAYYGWTGDLVVFNGRNPLAGEELWVTDGTPNGTGILQDIYRSSDSRPDRFTRVGSVVFFMADDGNVGKELWKTDGTPSGTFLVKDIQEGTSSTFVSNMTAALGKLFFQANDGISGSELWVSDGSTAGTFMVKDINPGSSGSSPESLVATATGILFSANDGTSGSELWRSDGTEAGTTLVKDINPGGGSSSPTSAVALANSVLFKATDGANGYELWESDGSAAGTVMVKDIRSGPNSSYPGNFTVFNGEVYFSASDGLAGTELWKTDASAAGTVLVKDIRSGLSSSSPKNLTASGPQLFLTANDGSHGVEIWKTDGTSAGTSLVKDINPGSSSGVYGKIAQTNFGIFFGGTDGTHGLEPWKSDGTVAGTVMIKDINPTTASSSFNTLLSTGPQVYFQAEDGVNGNHLWISDGTANGTFSLTPQPLSAGSEFGNIMSCSDTFMFGSANDGINGSEPWTTDSTSAGTIMLAEIYPGSIGSSPYRRAVLNGDVFFVPIDPTFAQEMWTTDCTPSGTGLLKDINPSGSFGNSVTAVSGGTLFFDADDGTNGRELWKSDGTSGGTVMVKDINPTGSSFPSPYPFGSVILLRADDGVTGKELWISDGSLGGTTLVKDINPGPNGSSVYDIQEIGPIAVFRANDGVNGTELWRTDGSSTGTSLVLDINPGPASALTDFYGLLTEVGGRAFFAAADGVHGEELWITDGTSAGTVLVMDVNPGPESSNPSYLLAIGATLYFVADDGSHGKELWRSDGTPDGTFLFADIWPGEKGSDPIGPWAIDGLALYTAGSPEYGRELWVTDGTSSGTRLLVECNPGPASSLPSSPTLVGNSIVFSAESDMYGQEPWKTCGTKFYRDDDGDGHGDPNRSTFACSPPPSYEVSNDDCDDALAGVHPGATEVCDQIDNDCNAQIDEPAFSGVSSATVLGGGSCGIRLEWSQTSACAGQPVYNVYRDTSSGFTPNPAQNLVASCVTQSTLNDMAVNAGTTYHYIVRSENPSTGGTGPCFGGGEDGNLIEVSATPGSCVTAPGEVAFLTSTAGNLKLTVEWVNPSAGYGLTRICWTASGYPTGPTDGTCRSRIGSPGVHDSIVHDAATRGYIGTRSTDRAAITNGTLYYYGVFVNSAADGSGQWSGGRFVTGRPFDTAGASKWAYTTGATSLSPSGILPGDANFSTSNDRNLHSTQAGLSGGAWPPGWQPAAMNAPSDGRPIVVTLPSTTVSGAGTLAFVGSQDGRVYLFDTTNGTTLWRSDILGDAVQASPSADLKDFGGSNDLVLVGSRSPSSDSKFYGLRLADGATQWVFDNGGGKNGIGIISSQAFVDYGNDRIFFTSRRNPEGSSDTVWCLGFQATTATKLWSFNAGDIDAAPNLRDGVLYVGNTSGQVFALNAASGAELWSTPYSTGDGAVKGYVWVDRVNGSNHLYFSTFSQVHALFDHGSSVATMFGAINVADPSPIMIIDDDLYVASSQSNGSILRLEKSTGVQLGSETIGDPLTSKALGVPAFDGSIYQVIIGTEGGRVYAVSGGF